MYVILQRRLFSTVAVLFLLSYGGNVLRTQALYEVNFNNGKKDYGLALGEVFLNLTHTPRVECFYRCSMDCRCSAFQMFKDTQCQLLSSSRLEMTLQSMPGYTYYDVISGKGTSCSLDCCKQNPCLHGGTCEPPSDDDAFTIRFRCRCLKGYGGKWCEYRVGCSGYLDTLKSRANGVYTMVNPKTKKSFQVYCRFQYSEKGELFARTLIQSYALQNVSQIRPFTQDSPINEYDLNWKAWRLSKANMELIANYSSAWYARCDFEKRGWNSSDDFVVVNFDKFNILKEDNAYAKCTKAEIVTIRGETCYDCDIPITQTSLYPLYVNTDQNSVETCGGSIPSESAECHEASFGWYQCVHTDHICASSPQSTTQHWFE